jgi:endoglucanase
MSARASADVRGRVPTDGEPSFAAAQTLACLLLSQTPRFALTRAGGGRSMERNRVGFGSGAVARLAIGMTALAGFGAGCGDLADEPGPEPSALHSTGSPRVLGPDTQFYVPPANPDAKKQITALKKAKRKAEAAAIQAMVETPSAVWFTEGTPKEVEKAVRKTMKAVSCGTVPVLVAYNLPFRDCAQYSAGGALDNDAYKAWIDGFARGIGDKQAVVILEPDGLGIIPNNTTIYGANEWCTMTVPDGDGGQTPIPGATPADRYALINYAVDSILAQAPAASVYLDGTHSAWLGVGEAAYRLYTAGIQRAQGFFLNTSNYQPTDQNVTFGTWVSDCITAALAGAPWAAGHFDWCPSQYDAALGYALNYSPEYAAGVTASLANMMGGAAATTHFVIDTSRNGQGAWTPTAAYPDAQTWCNPPDRGVGLRPTAATGLPLVDAALWIKIPGESDGSCNRGVSESTVDPEWGGIVDPAAGKWFPEQALDLATLASPPLL